MKKTLKGFYLLVTSLFIALLHLPFAFAKPVFRINMEPGEVPVKADLPTTPTSFKSVYDSLQLNMSGLSREAFEYAQKGWKKLIKQGKVMNQSVIAIVDFSLPSSEKRLFVLDMNDYKLLYNTLVAHGRNSGKERATIFSNQPSSYKSSPGFYITGATYNGSNGYSLKLNGVEYGINDKAMKRAIVMHGADYVDESYISSQGYIGRSQGCPAVPVGFAQPIINTLKEGACLFIYSPDRRYLSRSSLLRG